MPGKENVGDTGITPHGEKFVVESSGENNDGNRYSARDFGHEAPNDNAIRYSNRDGSWYYSNADGSTYYNDGKGGSQYTPPKLR